MDQQVPQAPAQPIPQAPAQPIPQAPAVPQQPAAQTASAPRQHVYAGFMRRLGAALTDGFILFIASWVLGFILGILQIPAEVGQLLTYLVVFVYFIYFTYKDGATPGKKILKIEVIREDGQKLTLVNVVLRETINKFISGVIFYLGYLWVIWDEKKQAWHDKLSSTLVVRTG